MAGGKSVFPKKATAPKKVVKEPVTKIVEYTLMCLKCGDIKKANFYESVYKAHSIHKKIPWCKTCIKEFYSKYTTEYEDVNKTIYLLCRKLGIVFSLNCLKKIIAENKFHINLILKYISESNQYAKTLKIDGFDDGDHIDIEDKANNLFDEFEVTPEMILFWGNFERNEDFVYLEQQYANWERDFACDNISEKLLIKDLCITDLQLRHAIEKNDIKTANELRRSRKETLAASGLSPSQMKDAGNATIETFGNKIFDIENNEPAEFFEDRDLFKDHDNINSYIEELIYRPIKNIITDSRDFDTPKLDQLELDKKKNV